MDGRDDALCKAAELILRLRDGAAAIPDAVATVGRIEVEPGGVNVIPGRARSAPTSVRPIKPGSPG